jgi:DNA-directed RNA polymerase specialized sigma24 family protein
MITAIPSALTFEQSLEHANRLASHLLRSPLGAHTSEDVVSRFIEKQLRAGKSEAEIKEMLDKPGLYRRLDHIKNDIFRWETAKKRGSREPRVSFEAAEPILSETMDDPESEMIRKEDFAHMNDILNRLIAKADLSETQQKILYLDREGFTSEEIARALGVEVEVVYSRRSEAVRKLALAAARYMSKDKK